MGNELSVPIFFRPQFKEKIWGGNRISSYFSTSEHNVPPNCGESWMLSSIEGSVSVAKQGLCTDASLDELIEKHKAQLMGHLVYERYGIKCPLLVKLIDAADDLSVQVHPNDQLAETRHQSLGKTEIWYILQASSDARIISGFNQRISSSDYLAHLEAGTLLDALHYESATQDDVFFMPAGRIHNTGKGIFLAEIQQCSDITYRIYDFDRKDQHGDARRLHIKESVSALDFRPTQEAKTLYTNQPNAVISLLESPFCLNKIHSKEARLLRDMRHLDSFVIYLCISGSSVWESRDHTVPIHTGDCVLVPAELTNYAFHSRDEVILLEAYMPEFR